MVRLKSDDFLVSSVPIILAELQMFGSFQYSDALRQEFYVEVVGKRA